MKACVENYSVLGIQEAQIGPVKANTGHGSHDRTAKPDWLAVI